MNNRTSVCTNCRTTQRKHPGCGPKTCPECGKPVLELGDRWRIPRKNDRLGWKKLAAKLAALPYYAAKLKENPLRITRSKR